MKVLIIGGTGTISMAVTKLLVIQGHKVTVINRGTRNNELPDDVEVIQCDISDEKEAEKKLIDRSFDCVAQFVGFVPEQVERDFKLFNGRIKQYIFVSSASAYQKPPSDCVITESTPLINPYWKYSRDKIACEEYLMKQYRENGFPITIVRPSHTYDERNLPLGVHGKKGSWQVMKRMIEGKPVIVHGDGTSLWTVTHNSDFAKGFVGLIGNIHAIGQTFHVTSDESITWNQVFSIIADELGVKLNAYHISSDLLSAMCYYDLEGTLIGDKAHSVIFDNSKIKRVVPTFRAVVRADQGLRDTVRYILANKECQKEDDEFDKWCDRVITALEQMKRDFLNPQ